MFDINSGVRRVAVFGAVASLSLALGACSGGGPSGSSVPGTSATDAVRTSTPESSAPNVAANGDFCSQAIDSVAASNRMTEATDALNVTLADPTSFASGDITPIRELSQAMMDSATVAAGFYAAGAAHASDPDARAAFGGLSDFVDQYSVPLARAGLDATSMTEYATSVTTMLTDPGVQALLPQASGWAATVADYTQRECGMAPSSDS